MDSSSKIAAWCFVSCVLGSALFCFLAVRDSVSKETALRNMYADVLKTMRTQGVFDTKHQLTSLSLLKNGDYLVGWKGKDGKVYKSYAAADTITACQASNDKATVSFETGEYLPSPRETNRSYDGTDINVWNTFLKKTPSQQAEFYCSDIRLVLPSKIYSCFAEGKSREVKSVLYHE